MSYGSSDTEKTNTLPNCPSLWTQKSLISLDTCSLLTQGPANPKVCPDPISSSQALNLCPKVKKD